MQLERGDTMNSPPYTSRKRLNATHMIISARWIVLLVALLIALIGCNGSVEQQASPEPQKPPASEPTLPPKTVPKVSAVDVTIWDQLTAGQSNPISLGMLFNAGLENTYPLYGDEVFINLHGMDGGSRLSEDDLRSRLQITPDAEFSITADTTTMPQYQIKIKADRIDLAEVLVRAEPTEPDAPRFRSDLRYTLRRVEEPKYAVSCVEHPGLREGVVPVVPAGKKHLTMRLTHPIDQDTARTIFETQYRASEIRWKNDLEVDFTVDLKWGEAAAFVPPAPKDSRGIAFRMRDRYAGLWCGQVAPSLLVDQPNHAVDFVPMTTLTNSAITSPDGRYAVVLETIPFFVGFGDGDSSATMYLMSLENGSRTPLMDNVVRYQRDFGAWTQDSTVFATADGYSIGYSGIPSQRGAYVFGTTGRVSKITPELEQYAGIRGLAVSPTGTRLLVGFAEPADPKETLYPLVIRMYASDGTLLRGYGVGRVRPTARGQSSLSIVWNPDGKSALIHNCSSVDSQGIVQDITLELNLETGETHVVPDGPIHRVYSPNGQAFVACDRKAGSYVVHLSSGEKITSLNPSSSRFVWSPDGSAVAYRNEQGYLMVFDLKAKQTDQWLTTPILEVLGWTPKGVWVLPVPKQ